jgi:hypothetical protein
MLLAMSDEIVYVTHKDPIGRGYSSYFDLKTLG